jgi:hypothetical protein
MQVQHKRLGYKAAPRYLPLNSGLALQQEDLELLYGLAGGQVMQVKLQRRRVLRVSIDNYLTNSFIPYRVHIVSYYWEVSLIVTFPMDVSAVSLNL